MGEAKRRAVRRQALFTACKPLPTARFNLYALGSRRSPAYYACEEISYWSSFDERLIGFVGRDRTDDDYLWMVLARDQNGCFRCARVETDYQKFSDAEEGLLEEIKSVVEEGKVEEYGSQGDETNAPLDLLEIESGFNKAHLHPYFQTVLDDPARAPARAVFKEIGPWLAPQDPHLVKEFQTKGFDQRLWELYLWAAFREFGLDVELLVAPDFRCTAPGIDFCVEATTAAPTEKGALAEHPKPQTIEETKEFLDNYMPLKYGSSLYSKLNKVDKNGNHYWEREQSRNKPFALAIADFHVPAKGIEIGSMTYTQSALWQYLYGSRVTWNIVDDGIEIIPEKIQKHKFGDKEAPSGFFDLPKADNISAIIFSNAGTLAKFDRMGVAAGFGADGYQYHRVGLRYDPDPNAVMGIPFSEQVRAEGYKEYWTQEVQVFHNPNATQPLPFPWLIGATHHYFEGGVLKSHTPSDAILSSYTMILRSADR